MAAAPAKRPVSGDVDPDLKYVIDVYDPFEGFNRGMWRFNAGFDELVFLPVVRAYEAVMPDPLQEAVSNFFSNIYEFTTFTNALAQGKFTAAMETAARFTFNSTFGLAGFIDFASRSCAKLSDTSRHGRGSGKRVRPSNARTPSGGLLVALRAMNATSKRRASRGSTRST